MNSNTRGKHFRETYTELNKMFCSNQITKYKGNYSVSLPTMGNLILDKPPPYYFGDTNEPPSYSIFTHAQIAAIHWLSLKS